MSSETIIPPDSDTASSRSNSTRVTEADSESALSQSMGEKEKETSDKCKKKEQRKKRIWCGTLSQCALGVVFVCLSVTGLVFTPQDFMLWEKLNMRPGLPPFDWWADPPDEVKLRAYVFNVTNHERFLLGLDKKLNVEEIGPIVYLEKLLHSNIRFNENSTMTYTAQRVPIYLPDENNVDLNATLIVPNMAVLYNNAFRMLLGLPRFCSDSGMFAEARVDGFAACMRKKAASLLTRGLSSYLHNANYFVRTAFRLLVSSQHGRMFARKTVYEYLWDFKDPVLDTSKTIVPSLVPVDNMGILARIYSDFTDELTVKIGPRWGHEQFFQINRFRGEPQIPGYDPDKCPDRIFGSTEGVMYRQRLTKEDVLLYWRKTVCKLMPLYFDSELTVHSVPVYRYNLSESVYERVKNGTDCYDTVPSLPAGVSDASKCYFDYPMVVSYPHFYTGGVPKDAFVTGLKPDRFKHNSYVVVEPLTGTPFHSVARMQSNLRINNLSGFSAEYDKFSNMIIPLFWAEYNQEGLPPRIHNMIYFLTVILPPLSKICLALILVLGFYLVIKHIHTKLSNKTLKTILLFKSRKVNNLAKNKIFLYEKETFLKRHS